MITTEQAFRMQLGGERGRKIFLKEFFLFWFENDPAGASRLVEVVIPNMPREDQEWLLGYINVFNLAMQYEDE
jgi:hypothetical protein